MCQPGVYILYTVLYNKHSATRRSKHRKHCLQVSFIYMNDYVSHYVLVTTTCISVYYRKSMGKSWSSVHHVIAPCLKGNILGLRDHLEVKIKMCIAFLEKFSSWIASNFLRRWRSHSNINKNLEVVTSDCETCHLKTSSAICLAGLQVVKTFVRILNATMTIWQSRMYGTWTKNWSSDWNIEVGMPWSWTLM